VISLCSWRRGRSQKRRKRRKKTNRQRKRDVPWTMEMMAAIRRCADTMVGGVDGTQEERGPRDNVHCARDVCHFCSEKARRKIHCN
jgi:hypothetical protein